MDISKYGRSPTLRRHMNIMDTVSGRSCKYTRIPPDNTGDAYIQISSLGGGNKSREHSQGHVEDGQSKLPGIMTCSPMVGYSNGKDESIQQIVYNGSYSKDILESREFDGSLALRRKNCRFIKKSGHCNVSHAHLKDKPQRFMADIFTTCVDLRWRWNLLLFSTAFVVSWLLFAVVYWITGLAHGDFEAGATSMCINNLDPDHAFTSAFLFSLETQTTIGYGFRVVTEECPVAIITVVVQSVFGCIIDAFMIGLIMAKISRPKKRAETLLFSRRAAINVRDGQLCLMVRVGNLRKSHLVEATIRMQYLYSRETLEGEIIPLEQVDLHLDLKNDSDRLFLVTPQTICHPIDENSPLFSLTKESLPNTDFEIIVILEGMVEATGMTTQARASYLPDEILWGHRFENVISFSHTNGYNVDFRKFHDTYETPEAPICSAAELRHPELLSNGSSNTSRTIRQSTSSTIRQRIDCTASEGRDSGFTAVEDDHATDSTKTLNSTSSGGSDFSGREIAPKHRSWVKRKKDKCEVQNTKAIEESLEKSGTAFGLKRNSIEREETMTRARNEKNASLTVASMPRKAEENLEAGEGPVSATSRVDSVLQTVDTIDETKHINCKTKAQRSGDGALATKDQEEPKMRNAVLSEPDENESLLARKSAEDTTIGAVKTPAATAVDSQAAEDV